MKIKEYKEEITIVLAWWAVFVVGLPIFAYLSFNRSLDGLWPVVVISTVVFIPLGMWLLTGGPRKLTRRIEKYRSKKPTYITTSTGTKVLPPSGRKFPKPKWKPEDAVNLYLYGAKSGALKLAPGEKIMSREEAEEYFGVVKKPENK